MQPKLRIWLVFDERTKLGKGRAELLRLIHDTGSLKQAAAKLAMSYRAAWGYVRELERAVGAALLEPAGSGRSGGTQLTRKGRDLIRRYEAFRSQIERIAAQRFRRIFASTRRPPPRRRRGR